MRTFGQRALGVPALLCISAAGVCAAADPAPPATLPEPMPSDLEALSQATSWSSFGFLTIVLQLFCLIHLFKTRADWRWLLLIFFLPFFGSIIYLCVEGGRRFAIGIDTSMLLRLPMLEYLDLRSMERAFALSDTAVNRRALAEAYLGRGRVSEAVELYRGALDGPLRKDVVLLFGYAKAQFAAGDDASCLDALRLSFEIRNNERQRQRHLLAALAYERQGDPDRAEEHFQLALPGFDGEEARCRYGLFCMARGRTEAARAAFAKVLDSAEHATWRYRRMQSPWIRLARARMRELAAAS